MEIKISFSADEVRDLVAARCEDYKPAGVLGRFNVKTSNYAYLPSLEAEFEEDEVNPAETAEVLPAPAIPVIEHEEAF